MLNKETERLTRELDEYPVTVDAHGHRTVVIPSELFDRTLDALRTKPPEARRSMDIKFCPACEEEWDSSPSAAVERSEEKK